MKIMELIKKHPYITTGVVVGGAGALFLISSAGSSSAASASTASGGVDDATAQAQISAEAQLQGASLAAGVQNTQTAAQQEVADRTLTTQLATTQDQDASAVTINQSNNNAGVAITANNNNTAVQEYQLQASAALASQAADNANQQVLAADALQTTSIDNQASLEGLIISGIANSQPTTTTKTSSGFLGIGGGSKTTVTPNANLPVLQGLLNQIMPQPTIQAPSIGVQQSILQQLHIAA